MLRSRWTWLALAAVVFFSFLGRAPISGDHERRVTETAQNMARAGWPWAATPIDVPRASGGTMAVNPWLVPVFEGQTRLQKPPLPYWSAAVLDRIFGEGPGSARFVPALLGALSMLLVYRLGLRVGGRHVGFVAMIAWVSTHFVIDEYRKAMADPYLACFTLAAIVAWVESSFASTDRRGKLFTLAFYSALGLACIAKGPIAFLHVALAVGAFTYSLRRGPRGGIVSHLGGLLVWAAISLPWPIAVLLQVPDALQIWGSELDKDRNPRPFYFYLHSPFLMSVPWTYAWVAGIVLIVARRSRRLAFPLLWLGATLLVFSFGHMKKNAYLMPAAPAVVLIAAQAAVRGIAFARLGRRRDQVNLLAHIHTGVGIAVAVAIGVLIWKQHAAGLNGLGVAIGVSMIALLVSLAPLTVRPAIAFGTWLNVQAFAFAVLIGAFIAFPQADKRDRDRTSRPTTTSTTPTTLPD